jgi:hypothetical protein
MAWLSLNRKFGLFWWNIATLAIPQKPPRLAS